MHFFLGALRVNLLSTDGLLFNSLPAGYALLLSADFFQNKLFEKNFQEYHQSVKLFLFLSCVCFAFMLVCLLMP